MLDLIKAKISCDRKINVGLRAPCTRRFVRTGWCLTGTVLSTTTATTTGPSTAGRGSTTTPPSPHLDVSTSLASTRLERDARQLSSRWVRSVQDFADRGHCALCAVATQWNFYFILQRWAETQYISLFSVDVRNFCIIFTKYKLSEQFLVKTLMCS